MAGVWGLECLRVAARPERRRVFRAIANRRRCGGAEGGEGVEEVWGVGGLGVWGVGGLGVWGFGGLGFEVWGCLVLK
jgi:hypothetical protein